MAQKLAALLGKNRVGPLLYTEQLRNPQLQIRGADGVVQVELFATREGTSALVKEIFSNGVHRIPASPYTRICHAGSSDIVCTVHGE